MRVPNDLRAASLGRSCTQSRTHEKSTGDGEIEEGAGGRWWWSRYERLQLARRDLHHLRCIGEAIDADFASRELAETLRGTLRQDLLHRPFSELGACTAEHVNCYFGIFRQLFGHLGHPMGRGFASGASPLADTIKRSKAHRMSALGQKQTFAVQNAMSALPPKADSCTALAHVRFGPIADIITMVGLALLPKFPCILPVPTIKI